MSESNAKTYAIVATITREKSGVSTSFLAGTLCDRSRHDEVGL